MRANIWVSCFIIMVYPFSPIPLPYDGGSWITIKIATIISTNLMNSIRALKQDYRRLLIEAEKIAIHMIVDIKAFQLATMIKWYSSLQWRIHWTFHGYLIRRSREHHNIIFIQRKDSSVNNNYIGHRDWWVTTLILGSMITIIFHLTLRWAMVHKHFYRKGTVQIASNGWWN